MKKTLRAVFALVFLFAVSSIAQGMCVELCTPCVGKKKDQTCKKVEDHCHCAALLDSLKQVQAAKEAALEESQNKLSQELQQTCDKQICTRAVTFENGLFKGIGKAKPAISAETAQSVYDSKINESRPSMTRIEPLPPMNGECSSFCGDCPVTEKMLKSKKPKFRDKFCKKIEESCKCIDYAINAKQLEEQAKADSAAEFESKIKRIENASLLSKTLHSQCEMNEPCALTVTIANKELFALDIQKTKEEVKEVQEPVATVEEKTAEAPAAPTQETASATEEAEPQQSFREVPQKQKVFHEVEPGSSYKDSKNDKKRNSYFGFSLAFDFPESDDFYGIYFEGAPKSYDFGISLGFLFRTYFNKVVSFNLGFNAIVRFADYDGYYLYTNFSTLMAEIPLGFRFGIPLGPLPISPFVSTSFHIRKPIYHWIYIETDSDYSSYAWSHWNKDSRDGESSIDEWEFVPLLGAGLEISRHFSFEFQWYIGSFCTHSGSFHEAYEYGDSWRIKFDITF